MSIHSIAIRRMAQATYEESGKPEIENIVKSTTKAITAIYHQYGVDAAKEWAEAFQGVFDAEADLIKDVLLEVVDTLEEQSSPQEGTEPEEVIGSVGQSAKP